MPIEAEVLEALTLVKFDITTLNDSLASSFSSCVISKLCVIEVSPESIVNVLVRLVKSAFVAVLSSVATSNEITFSETAEIANDIVAVPAPSLTEVPAKLIVGASSLSIIEKLNDSEVVDALTRFEIDTLMASSASSVESSIVVSERVLLVSPALIVTAWERDT